MARQAIAVGSTSNDGTGDSLRVAGTKSNANFTELYSASFGDTVASDQWLLANFPAVQFSTITRDTDDVVSSATVIWPDGSGGTFTTTEKHDTLLVVDAFTVTHTLSGKTLTQPAVTRNADGSVVTQPEITVT